MKKSPGAASRRPLVFAMLTALCFCGCFILLPLGNFTIWITVGGTVYFLFLTVYSLVPKQPTSHKGRRKRTDPKADEMKAYVQFHLRNLLIMFVVAACLVIVFLWFVA